MVTPLPGSQTVEVTSESYSTREDRIAMAEDIHGTHTFGKRSDPGDHKTLCGDRVRGVLGNTHVGACVLKRTADAPGTDPAMATREA